MVGCCSVVGLVVVVRLIRLLSGCWVVAEKLLGGCWVADCWLLAVGCWLTFDC